MIKRFFCIALGIVSPSALFIGSTHSLWQQNFAPSGIVGAIEYLFNINDARWRYDYFGNYYPSPLNCSMNNYEIEQFADELRQIE